MTPNGYKDAIADPAQIDTWWQIHPEANIGIVTGRESGLAVLDVDPRHEGDKTLTGLEAQYGPLPATPKVQTGGGGWHLYFQYPKTGIGCRNGFLQGLDLKGDGGYVIGAGSRHASGNDYFWMPGCDPEAVPLAEMPEWLLSLCRKRPTTSAKISADPYIPEGGRRTHLLSLGGLLRSKGSNASTIDAALRAENQTRCQPPLPEKEVHTLATDIAERYPSGSAEDDREMDWPANVAAEFLELQPERLLFWRDEWWQYSGIHYRVVTDAEISTQIMRHLQERHRRKATPGFVNNVEANLQALRFVSPAITPPQWLSEINKSVAILPMRNGLLNIDAWLTGEANALTPHSDDYFCTFSLRYDFVPDAWCQKFLAFLAEVQPEADDRRLLQQFAGYCLIPGNSMHKFMILVGNGSNGKSVFCNLLTELLGTENVSAVSLETLGQRFGLWPTHGKLANIAADVGEIDKAAEGIMKALTAGDALQFERKHADPFMAKATAKLLFATNTLPRFTDRTDGLWRRLLLVPFQKQIPASQQNPRLLDELREELPGILMWALSGLRSLREAGGFQESRAALAAKLEYRLESNPVQLFLQECSRWEPEALLECAQLYARYKEYCHAHGYRALGEVQFGKEVRRVYPQSQRVQRRMGNRRMYVYLGIQLVTAEEVPDTYDPELTRLSPDVTDTADASSDGIT